jgi:hypothetical protein
VLEREAIGQPLHDEERDGGDIDPIGAHVARSPMMARQS